MHRTLRVWTVIAIAIMFVFVLWARLSRTARPTGSPALKDTVQSALTKPVQFAKSRLTGGVGVALGTDQATGFPVIEGVAIGSPSDTAGLLVGDLLVRLDGLLTKGRPLAQIVEQIRGFTGRRVTLTVQRSGSTNLECVIRRRSWNNLRGLSYNRYE